MSRCFSNNLQLPYHQQYSKLFRSWWRNILLGQYVEVLSEGYLQAGEYHINWAATGLPSGIYFARL
jgi:hypothetical protein